MIKALLQVIDLQEGRGGFEMAKKRLILLFMAILIVIACQPSTEPQVYDHPEFTFTYPARWRLMSELFPKHEAGKEYYRLGVQEIVMVTSARKAGEFGVYFAVASAPLPEASDLETFTRQRYQPIMEELRNYSEQEVTLGQLSAIEVTYHRPWGEPWWQFRDLWLEKNGRVYLLSFHASSLEPHQQEMNAILDSFSFK